MATDFWGSSHYKRWIVDRATLREARADDLQYVDDPEHLNFLPIFFANVISKLGKKLQLRQRVIATATVFFRRFYIKNSYCETDPFIVVAACCYVAAKAEESPVHIKNVIAEARALFTNESYSIKSFPSDNSKLAEMEFYLVDDLECDLTVFHPYRTLMSLCKKENDTSGATEIPEAEAGELGTGVGSEDGPKYWGTGEGQLEMQTGALQMAWFVINDTYRSELCLLYPPHLIAIASIYFSLILYLPTRNTILSPPQLQSQSHILSETQQTTPTPTPRRSSRQAINAAAVESSKKPTTSPDPIKFLSELNVSLPLIATISQEIISMYALWTRYKEDANPEVGKTGVPARPPTSPLTGATTGSKRSGSGSRASRSGSSNSHNNSNNGTPAEMKEEVVGSEVHGGNSNACGSGNGNLVTPAFLTGLLMKMREGKMADMAQPASGRPVAINKMLERTQAAG